MKNLFLSLLAAVICFSAAGQEPKPQHKKPEAGEVNRPPRPPRDEKLRKELLDKYDSNKDGVLSIDEREKITPEDKAKLRAAGFGRGPKGPGPKGPGPKGPGPKGPRGDKPEHLPPADPKKAAA